jgi:hypothetical protein
MKVTINTSGHIPLARSYDIDSSAVPNLGDTVVIDGTPLEVYERVFNLNKPGEVDLLCKPKSHSS